MSVFSSTPEKKQSDNVTMVTYYGNGVMPGPILSVFHVNIQVAFLRQGLFTCLPVFVCVCGRAFIAVFAASIPL